MTNEVLQKKSLNVNNTLNVMLMHPGLSCVLTCHLHESHFRRTQQWPELFPDGATGAAGGREWANAAVERRKRWKRQHRQQQHSPESRESSRPNGTQWRCACRQQH